MEGIRQSAYLSTGSMAMTLRESAVTELLELVHELGSAADLDSLRQEGVRQLRRLIGCDSVTWVDIDATRRRVAGALDPVDAAPPAALDDVYWQFRHQNPVGRYRRATGDEGPLKLSDFATPHELRRLALYEDFFRPSGVAYQLSVVLVPPRPSLSVLGCNRGTRDFTERERDILRLLRPHLVRAQQRVLMRMRSRHAAITAVPADLAKALRVTPREAEILLLVARGRTNREIGSDLFVSPRTVQKHLERVFGKLGVRTRTEAAAAVFAATGGTTSR